MVCGLYTDGRVLQDPAIYDSRIYRARWIDSRIERSAAAYCDVALGKPRCHRRTRFTRAGRPHVPILLERICVVHEDDGEERFKLGVAYEPSMLADRCRSRCTFSRAQLRDI